jgi:hypothetical protein
MLKKVFMLAMVLGSVLVMNICPVEASSNVALGQTVTLSYPSLFYRGGWSTADTGGLPSTITDGIYLSDHHEWDQDTVYWNVNYATADTPQYITIDLAGTFRITSFSIQADDNEAYLLYYLDTSGNWQLAWTIPVAGGWGMRTRTIDGLDIVTTALKFTYLSGSGDEWKSVSEIDAFGTPVPVPAAFLLFGSGMMGLAGFRKKIFGK